MQERVAHASKILNLDPYLKRFPRELSGGQRQRVAMGRAIVRDPKVFLFDEPLSNLDAKLRVAMRAEIKALHQRLKTTTVYVTHDQVEAMTMADRIVVMHDGRIEQIGEPLELYDHPGQPVRRAVHRLAGDERGQGHGQAQQRRGVRRHGRRRAVAAAPGPGRRGPGGRLWRAPRRPVAHRRERAGRRGRRDRRRGADGRGDGAPDPGGRGAAHPRHARPPGRQSRAIASGSRSTPGKVHVFDQGTGARRLARR